MASLSNGVGGASDGAPTIDDVAHSSPSSSLSPPANITDAESESAIIPMKRKRDSAEPILVNGDGDVSMTDATEATAVPEASPPEASPPEANKDAAEEAKEEDIKEDGFVPDPIDPEVARIEKMTVANYFLVLKA